MRHLTFPLITMLTLVSLNSYGQESKSKGTPKLSVPVSSTQNAPTAKPTVDEKKEKTTASDTVSHIVAEDAAIRKAGESYVKAFNNADAGALSEHYTADAEYIDENGVLIQGRGTIEKSLKSFFEGNPGSKLTLDVKTIRIIGPGLAIEEGTATITRKDNSNPAINRYTAVQAKHGGKWLLASVRDTAIKQAVSHKAQLRQLDWMLGEWVHEGRDALVVFDCKAVDNGNFLLREYKIQIAGQETQSGSQRIGWDAQAGKFKAWIFDSDGGHSEGYWHRDGDSWVLKLSGTTAAGQSASSTSNYTFTNAHTMTFQSVDHEVAGVEFPDSPKIKIVRHAPRPE